VIDYHNAWWKPETNVNHVRATPSGHAFWGKSLGHWLLRSWVWILLQLWILLPCLY